VQFWRGPRAARGPGWVPRGRRRLAEHTARCLSCRVANGIVHQVVPSGTVSGSSELVKAHTLRRGRPSRRISPSGLLVRAAPRSRSGTCLLPLRTRRVSYREVFVIRWVLLLRVGGSMIQPTLESDKILQPEASSPRRCPTGFLVRLLPQRPTYSFVLGVA
jgi:hypothetical protein